MNYEKYHTYVVEGKDALAKVEAFRQENRDRLQVQREWAKKFGGKDVIFRGQFIHGIVTDHDKQPTGPSWKRTDHQPKSGDVWWTYNYRTKAGRNIEREINRDELRRLDSVSLATRLGAGGSTWFLVDEDDGKSYMYDPQAWDVGEKVMLIVPKKDGAEAPAIDGCRLVKLSEFYAIIEAENEKKNSAAA